MLPSALNPSASGTDLSGRISWNYITMCWVIWGFLLQQTIAASEFRPVIFVGNTKLSQVDAHACSVEALAGHLGGRDVDGSVKARYRTSARFITDSARQSCEQLGPASELRTEGRTGNVWQRRRRPSRGRPWIWKSCTMHIPMQRPGSMQWGIEFPTIMTGGNTGIVRPPWLWWLVHACLSDLLACGFRRSRGFGHYAWFAFFGLNCKAMYTFFKCWRLNNRTHIIATNSNSYACRDGQIQTRQASHMRVSACVRGVTVSTAGFHFIYERLIISDVVLCWQNMSLKSHEAIPKPERGCYDHHSLEAPRLQLPNIARIP